MVPRHGCWNDAGIHEVCGIISRSNSKHNAGIHRSSSLVNFLTKEFLSNMHTCYENAQENCIMLKAVGFHKKIT